MSHTYASVLVHCVFSSKQRRPLLTPEVRERLWPFIGGIARANGFRAIAIGGYVDHAHALLALPTTIPVAKALQLLKAGSSKFVHEAMHIRDFQWQEGYGAFTIAASAVEPTVAYIRDQEEHHRTKTFAEEFVAFLKKNGVAYDERYVFG